MQDRLLVCLQSAVVVADCAYGAHTFPGLSTEIIVE